MKLKEILYKYDIFSMKNMHKIQNINVIDVKLIINIH